ncbi:hypothetical protein [Actinomycetospora sp. CA-084318]|uniref:hypothetical protein n=1 Tax=Actinomycetospora sp. CA-084318 TaxID=3239892 RepID=UPI003D981473
MSAVDLCHDHPAEIAGRYRLGPVLRRSPGCCSHRGTDRLLRRTVSVTLVEGDGLVLPAQSWHGRSPEVAEVYDGGPWHGRLFLVTQHPGATLAETTPPGGLSVAEVRDLGLAVADTYAPLHRRGRAHGGLGPGTVAWSDRGAAFSDVGLLPWLARWSDVRLDPPYPAPGRAADPAADVYALGRLLGELGPRRPPRAVGALIEDMTTASPAARPRIEDVADRLRSLPVPSRRRVGDAAARGRRAVVVAAAVLLLAGGAGVGALVTGSGAGSASAYAAAVDPTPVPGVPRPPALAAAPPLPGPAPTDDADVVDDVDAAPTVEAPRTAPAPVRTDEVPAFTGRTGAPSKDRSDERPERSERSDSDGSGDSDDSGRSGTSEDRSERTRSGDDSSDRHRDRDRSDDRRGHDDRHSDDRRERGDRKDRDRSA